MASRIPVTLIPPKRSGVKKHKGTLWFSGEKLHLEYRKRFSLPGKAPAGKCEIPFERIRRASYDEGIFGDEMLVVVKDPEALGGLPTADAERLRIHFGVDKDDRDEARSLVRQLQLDRMGDIFEDMLEITDIDPDPLL